MGFIEQNTKPSQKQVSSKNQQNTHHIVKVVEEILRCQNEPPFRVILFDTRRRRFEQEALLDGVRVGNGTNA